MSTEAALVRSPFRADLRSATAPRRRQGAVRTLLEASWRMRLLPRPVLSPDALIAAARRRARGLEDFGAPHWQARLALLCAAFEDEAALNSVGRVIAHGQIVSALADRLRIHALWRAHPEIADVPLAPPIVVLGQMRSGSTRMQRLLACDERFTHTRFFESWNPVPWFSARAPFDDRRMRAALGLGIAHLLNPPFAAIHPTWPDAPDEETGLYSPALFGAAFEAQWRVPAFARQCETEDARPVYRELRQLLQTLAWYRGEARVRPWVLKSPQMTQDIDALLDVFPGARFVVLHRDPKALVASSASLIHNQMRLQSDAAAADWAGREALRKVALRAQRLRDAAIPADRRVDVAFDAMNRDWHREMARVYAMLDLPLGPDLLAKMAGMQRPEVQQRLAQHRYALTDFGLSPATVGAALA